LENQTSWGLARASNTTPSLVFRFEGESEDALLGPMKLAEVFQLWQERGTLSLRKKLLNMMLFWVVK
jgi:hypothetical protein